MTPTNKPVLSEVIFNQLGGDSFASSSGASDFIPTKSGLIFRVISKGPRRARNGASHVQINLGRHERYDIGFYKFNPHHESLRNIDMIRGVLCDQIKNVITSQINPHHS